MGDLLIEYLPEAAMRVTLVRFVEGLIEASQEAVDEVDKEGNLKETKKNRTRQCLPHS